MLQEHDGAQKVPEGQTNRVKFPVLTHLQAPQPPFSKRFADPTLETLMKTSTIWKLEKNPPPM